MKIDPTEKQQPIITSNTDAANSPNRAGSQNNFAEVLDDTIEKKSKTEVTNVQPTPKTMAPQINFQVESQKIDSRMAYGMLSALEDYQQLLKDPSADLKTIEPSVLALKDLSEKTQALLDQTSQPGAVQEVVEEALVHISKEIERFYMGYYIDE